MQQQLVVMRGHSPDGLALMVKHPRSLNTYPKEHQERAYLLTQLYIAERANACSDFLGHDRMVAIFDLGRQAKGASPPLSWQYRAIQVVQQVYPERLHQLILLEPPFWMRGVFAALKPFLSVTTRNKISIVSSR